METIAEAARVARRQHGLITLTQAHAAGVMLGQLRSWLRLGHWTAIRPGVYAVAAMPPTSEQAVLAAVLSVDGAAYASHATAGALWGLPVPLPERIELVTDVPKQVRLDGVRGYRSRALFSADLTQRLRIPCTTPERTLVDVSGRLSAEALGRAVDDGLRRRILRLDALRRCVGRLEAGPGRRTSVVHDVLRLRLPGYDPGDSDFETLVLRALVARGLPPPVQQYRVKVGGRVVRIDLAYPGLRIAIELDGFEFHGTRTAFDDDRARANLLVVAGWTLLRFTTQSTIDEIVDTIAALVARSVQEGAA